MYITENVSRLISPLETFNKVEKILLENSILDSYGHFTSKSKFKTLFPNFYALGVQNEYVPLNPFVSYGKGFTTESALASALMELTERYSMFKTMKTKSVIRANISELKDVQSKLFYSFYKCLTKEKK